jgi:hypothetical protein
MRQFIKGFVQGFRDFGRSISTLVNTCLLLLVYFMGVGASALAARIAGKRFLSCRKSGSYWKPLNLTKKDIKSYYRQF